MMAGRTVLIGAGVVVLALGTAAAVYAGGRARTPEQRAARAEAPEPSLVTVPVHRGELVDELRLEGVVAHQSTLTVDAPTEVAGADRAVVTAMPAAVEDEIRAGQTLVELSGRPVIALAGAFPAYRDLHRGVRGPDVTQLQSALRSLYDTPVDGTFGPRTEQDLQRLYADAGYEPFVEDLPDEDPAEAGIFLPAGEVAFIAPLPATVSSVEAKVGDTDPEVLLTLAAGDRQVVVPVDAATETLLSGGGDLRLAGGPLDGAPVELTEIRHRRDEGQRNQEPEGEARPDQSSSGREAVFTVVAGGDALAAGSQAVMVTVARSEPDVLIVPVSALTTGADGMVSVTVADGDAVRAVDVTVELTLLGEAAISGDVVEGDQVVVRAR